MSSKAGDREAEIAAARSQLLANANAKEGELGWTFLDRKGKPRHGANRNRDGRGQFLLCFFLTFLSLNRQRHHERQKGRKA